jgi:hypothetical protein
MPDANDPPAPTATERLIHSLGNHLTLIETHAAQCRRQFAELTLTLRGQEVTIRPAPTQPAGRPDSPRTQPRRGRRRAGTELPAGLDVAPGDINRRGGARVDAGRGCVVHTHQLIEVARAILDVREQALDAERDATSR